MAKFRALMLWTDAWIADTKHLTRCERGTYHDLLVLMWRSPGCTVPNDDGWLAKHLGMTPAEVENELRPIISEFCQTDGNRIWQKRLKKEFGHSMSQSARAKSKWRKKKAECPKPGAADATVTVTVTDSKKEAASAAPQLPLADPEADLFRRGKEVAGKDSGGLIAKLFKAKNRNVALTRAIIETASTKQSPREYIAAVIRGNADPNDWRQALAL